MMIRKALYELALKWNQIKLRHYLDKKRLASQGCTMPVFDVNDPNMIMYAQQIKIDLPSVMEDIYNTRQEIKKWKRKIKDCSTSSQKN